MAEPFSEVLESKCYTKPSCSWLLLNFYAVAPARYKRGVVKIPMIIIRPLWSCQTFFQIGILIIDHKFVRCFRLSQTHFLFHFISLLPLVYFFHYTHDTKLGHINNSRITLKYVCIESWYTRKYNVKILILCALKILYLRPPQFFMYQPYTL